MFLVKLLHGIHAIRYPVLKTQREIACTHFHNSPIHHYMHDILYCSNIEYV